MSESPSFELPVPVSYEFFPPNTPVGSEKLKTVVQDLLVVAEPVVEVGHLAVDGPIEEGVPTSAGGEFEALAGDLQATFDRAEARQDAKAVQDHAGVDQGGVALRPTKIIPDELQADLGVVAPEDALGLIHQL